MVGDYNQDMVDALTEAGISDATYGNYSALITGADAYLPDLIDMLGDAALLIAYNQDPKGTVSDLRFALRDIEVSKSLPKCGQFNLIGYSWGAVVAARTAVYHAERGIVVDHLVLIGAPINLSLLNAVKNHGKIKKAIVINLGQYGDPIYAGITDEEIVKAAPKLAFQMLLETGHFYYSGSSETGRSRRRVLSKSLYAEGLR